MTNGRSKATATAKTVATVAAMLVAALGGACGGDDLAGAGGGGGGDTATVVLSLTSTPADAVCHRAVFSQPGAPNPMPFERTFDLAVGASAPVSLTLLPSGSFTLAVTAYAQACAMVPPGSTPTWVGDLVSVSLSPGTITGANVFMRRSPSATLVVDYDTATLIYTAPGGAFIRGLAVTGSTLFVADSAQVARLPEAGGGSTLVAAAPGIGTGAFAADANNLVWSAGSPAQMFRAPTVGFGTPRVLIGTGANSISMVPGIAVTLDLTTVRVVPTNLATPTSPTTVLGNMMTAVTADATNAYFTDGTGTLYRQALTSPGLPGVPPTTMFLGPNPPVLIRDLASDGTNLFFLTADSLRRIPVAGTAATTMVSFFPASTVALVVDATNVYYLTTATTSASPPACIGSTLSRIAKTGTTPTVLWSQAGLCPVRLAQSATGLFLADVSGNWVRRVAK